MNREFYWAFLVAVCSLAPLRGQGEANEELLLPYDPELARVEWVEDPGEGEDFARGVFEYLGSLSEVDEPLNPVALGWASLSSTELIEESNLSSVLSPEGSGVLTVEEGEAFVRVDFRRSRVAPQHYRIWMGDTQEVNFLRSWILEGSNDGDKWTPLSEISDSELLGAPGAAATFPVESEKEVFFAKLRLRQTGSNSSGNEQLQLARLELYGGLQYDPASVPKADLSESRDFDLPGEEDGEIATRQGLVSFLSEGEFGASDNPVLAGKLGIFASSSFEEGVEAWELFAAEPRVLRTSSEENQWIAFRLFDGAMDLKWIDLGIGKDEEDFSLSEFVIEAANGSGDWVELLSVNEEVEREIGKGFVRFAIPERADLNPFNTFRVRAVGAASANAGPVKLTDLDLYGRVFGSDLIGGASEEFCSTISFLYEPGFSEGGMIKGLANGLGNSGWINPVYEGQVAASASSVASDSAAVSALFAEEPQYFSTEDEPDAWVVLKLLKGKLSPTHYALRNVTAGGTGSLRSWEFQASNDGVQWFALRAHVNDDSLNATGETVVWSISQNYGGRPFRFFRVLAQGDNTGGDQALGISGIELYGDYCEPFGEFEPTPESENLDFDDDFGTNGILYRLGSVNDTVAYTNPADLALVEVEASSLLADSTDAASILDRQTLRCVTKPLRNSSFTLRFKEGRRVIPTHYSLRHYSSWDTEALRYWVLEASNDGMNWVGLREHLDDRSLSKKGQTASWAINPPANSGSFSQFRVRQTGPNSNNHYYLALSGFELFGTLETSPDETFEIPELPQQPEEGREFGYSSDFDGNGVVSYLATNDGQSPYINPVERGLMTVRASTIMPDSEAARSAVGNLAVRCVTRAIPNSYFEFTFGQLKVRPTHYSLRHYSSWDTEALRHWVFEGSNDRVTWRELSRHTDDTSLNRKGATHTWQLPTDEDIGFYQHFRVRQIGLNSNRHHFLALSGFDIYGSVVDLETDEPPADAPVPVSGSVPILLSGDAPADGVFQRLGTDNGNRLFQNPAFFGEVLVTSSSLMANSASLEELLSQNPARVVTKPNPNSWFAFEFPNHRLQPTAYALKHYSTWDTEAIRTWKFEGSNDGVSWVTLDVQVDNNTLMAKNQWAAFPLPPVTQDYRHFRILQTGRNSNQHHYLGLGAVELFGNLTSGNFGSGDIFNEWMADQGVSFETINRANPGAPKRQEDLLNQFAYGPNPEFQRVTPVLVEVGEELYGAATFLVRDGAAPVIGGSSEVRGSGLSYQLSARSSLPLNATDLSKVEVTPAVVPDVWPPAPAGYHYRTFRSELSVNEQAKAFFQVKVEAVTD